MLNKKVKARKKDGLRWDSNPGLMVYSSHAKPPY